MSRVLRQTPLQRRKLILFGLFAAFNIFLLTEYLLPRWNALALDDVYDPPTPDFDPLEPGTVPTFNVSATKPRVLLVSALFPLSKSKHGQSAYSAWLLRFLGAVTTEVYFYTSEEFAPTVRAARGPNLPLIVDASFSSPFDTPALQGREEAYNKMHKVDREREIHSPGLYAVWNAKPFLVENAIKMQRLKERKEYDYVFWNDAGSFREDNVYTDWPDGERVERIWEEGSQATGSSKEELIFFPMYWRPPKHAKGWKEDSGPLDSDISEGSFFGGTPKAVTWFSRTFYSYHDYYISLGFFVGKDQNLYNAVILLFPSRFITVWHGDPDSPARGGMPPNAFTRGRLGACGPEWYYYQWWLSDKHSREEMREYWMEHDREPDKAKWWKIRRIPCRMATLRGMEDVLKTTFGDDWTSPARTIGLRPSRMW